MTSREFRPSTLVPKGNGASQDTQESLAEELFLEGIVMRSCSDNDIEFSNALLVKVADEGEAPDKYKKIQDKVFFKAYAKICCIEKLCNRVDCKVNDTYAAEIVVEKLEGTDIKKLPDNDHICDIKVIDLPQTDSESTPQRKGIRYICRKTGYTEIACPIRLYDRTMGALIVGQIIEENNLDSWKITITELCKNASYPKDKMTELLNESRNAKSEREVQDIISKVSAAVQAIEKELKDVYKNRQEQYSLEQSNIFIDKFKEESNEKKRELADATNVYPVKTCIKSYENIGTCIRNCVQDICKKIGVQTYALFLPNLKNLTDNDYRQLRCGKMTLNLEEFLNDNDTNDSLHGKENIKRYMSSDAESEYDYMLVSQMEGYPISLLLCLDECLREIGSKDEKLLLTESIHDVFQKSFSFAQMAGIEAKSEYFRTYLDSSMSIMRHELGQSNAGYQMLLEQFRTIMERYLQQTSEYDYSPEEEAFQIFMEHCKNMFRNSEEYLYTTRIRMNSTKYLTEFKPKVKQLFYPYEEFLFKWQQIYYKTVKENNLHFVFPHVVLNDLSRPRMYGDPMMIEQAVYNLTNNAMKYAMQGTKVSLDCRLNEDKTKYEIVVKNIGMSFKYKEEKNSIFEYGMRGSNNEKEGSGLGLYLTRQIALGHRGNAKCEMKPLSKYNWSLIQLYINFYEDEKIRNLCKDKELYEELKTEWESKKDDIQKSIVREIPRTAFTPMYVHQNIRQGTTQFTFTFWIPYVE